MVHPVGLGLVISQLILTGMFPVLLIQKYVLLEWVSPWNLGVAKVSSIVSAFSWYTSMVPVSATPPVMVTVFVMYTMARAMLVESRVRTKATIPAVFFCNFSFSYFPRMLPHAS